MSCQTAEDLGPRESNSIPLIDMLIIRHSAQYQLKIRATRLQKGAKSLS